LGPNASTADWLIAKTSLVLNIDTLGGQGPSLFSCVSSFLDLCCKDEIEALTWTGGKVNVLHIRFAGAF